MNNETQQELIAYITIATVLTSLFFFVWDYNKTEIEAFNEIQIGYRDCLGECNNIADDGGKSHSDEVQCIKDCYSFYYINDANCTEGGKDGK